MDSAEFFLGTVTAVSSADGVQIRLDGQDEAMSKYYKMLITGANWPSVGDRVVIMKHSGTYVVMGKIGTPSQDAGKVNRGGDTMTGALTMNGADINLRSTTNTIGTVPASSVSDKRVHFRDKLNTVFGKLQSIFLNDGRVGMQLGSQRTVDGSLVENNVSLYIDASGTRSVTLSSPAAWRSALNAVNKSGDTMTGNLTIRDANLHMDDPNFSVGTRPSTNQWSKPFRIRDADGKTLGRIQGFYGTDGTCGLQFYADQLVNGEGKYNFLSMNIGESGAASINMNHPEAWRLALGLGTSGALPITVAQGGTGNTGVVTVSTVASIATAATGWNITEAAFSSWGKLAMVELAIRTTQQVTVTASTPIATIVSGKRPALDAPARVWLTTARACVISTDGEVLLNPATIAADTGLYIVSTYLLP